MANQISVNVYQINQTVLKRDQSLRMGFPSAGIILQDVTSSPTRSLNSGYNVYGLIMVPGNSRNNAQGTTLYYVQETMAQLITLANA